MGPHTREALGLWKPFVPSASRTSLYNHNMGEVLFVPVCGFIKDSSLCFSLAMLVFLNLTPNKRQESCHCCVGYLLPHQHCGMSMPFVRAV